MSSNDNLLPTVVEPPKFITARHVAAVFEKLGFEPSAGQKAFTILCEALTRIKTENKDKIDEADEDNHQYSHYHGDSPPPPPNAALARAFEDMDEGETPRKVGQYGTPEVSSNKHVATNTANTSSSNNTNGTNPADKASNNTNAKMDLHDFVRAVELDDILIQVIFRRTRYKMVSLFQEAEQKVRTQSEEDSQKNGSFFTEETVSTKEDPNMLRDESISRKSMRNRLSSKDVTANLIEEELKGLLSNLRTSESRPAFPIANAVGKY